MNSPRERLFRDDAGAAFERVAQLEEENARLRRDLVEARGTPEMLRWRTVGGALAAIAALAILVGAGAFMSRARAPIGASERSERESGIAMPVAVMEVRLPQGMSYESAVATYTDVPGARALEQGELEEPLRAVALQTVCGMPSEQAATLKIAIASGRAVGVSVYTTPRDPKLASCIDREVRRLRWPETPRVSGLTTVVGAVSGDGRR